MSNNKIDNENTLKNALINGVNLFVGAGFSVLPDDDGNILPESKDLITDICENFAINPKYKNDLEKLSNVVSRKNKEGFQNFLRKKYTVKNYNKLYNALNLINIKSYITTNIDNQIHCVMENSKKYFLNDVKLNGASKYGLNKIDYIPLHGCVLDINANLYFGKDELALVGNENEDLFKIMYAKMRKYTTIFLGYGFHDSAVYSTIVNIIGNSKGSKNVWIQCLPDSEDIDYFKDIGYNTICLDTKKFLEWLSTELSSENKLNTITNITFKEYQIPSSNNVPTTKREEYFCEGKTDWYCIFNKYAYVTNYYNAFMEILFSGKNLIITGMRFSGKTTLLMQCATSISQQKHDSIILFVESCTQNEARNILNKLSEQKALIFFDNCCDDINALKTFLDAKNVQIVGASEGYSYEISTHLLNGYNYSHQDISEISEDEMHNIYQYIPPKIRTDNFNLPYKLNTDRMSMFEFMNKNIKKIVSEKQVTEILNQIIKNSNKLFDILALTSYLEQNNSALNLDVLISFLGDSNYNNIKNYISLINDYLNDLNLNIEQDIMDQDYYVLRSKIFLYYVHKVLINNFASKYGDVVRHLILEVSPYNIYNKKTFQRSAYDADFFYKIFGNTANDLYDHIYSYDESPYTLQQQALYKMKSHDYVNAFSYIDLAINKSRNNFSMINTRAVITFEANKNIDMDTAHEKLHEAMITLKECYYNDKRKIYHAEKYAEFALYLYNNYRQGEYLEIAQKWLKECVNTFNKRELIRLKNDIDNAVKDYKHFHA